MNCVAGIDGGSRAIKVVVLGRQDRRILSTVVRDGGVAVEAIAESCLVEACTLAGIERGSIARLVATGYARAAISAAHQRVTEITCHARGVSHLVPGTAAVVEVGGQDSKVMRLDARGRVVDFAMNDRCAAGTGRFLEVVAARLGTDLPGLGALCDASAAPAAISSMCVVFAESEIIGLISQGAVRADIAAGVVQAVAMRVAALAGRDLPRPVAFTGGVALIPGFSRALSAALGAPVTIPELPQFTGALGAALIAADS
jgi:predicted CoA-substrate-specific enzyme activase